MYLTYGPNITRRAHFEPEIVACLEYCSSERFVVPYFAPYFSDSLRSIQAWCGEGREPRYPERRTAPPVGWVIGRELDDAGVPRAGEWDDMAARIVGVANYFEYWPTDQQLADGVKFWSMEIMTEPRAPSLDEVRAGAERIEAALREAGHWSARPLHPSKVDSNTLTPSEHLQFAFLPHVEELAGPRPVPVTIALTGLGNRMAPHRELWPVMYALSDFDQLFIKATWPDNVRRWPPGPPTP